ncbi:MAG TPA: glycine zipper 2TM domain-containing protein [Steroidobacteraceae bacterium]|nr:glycine zipper 2TM domain-containing protein [Steroidobacteraceae bacterium]
MRFIHMQRALRGAGLAALLMASIGVAVPALADPPSHAPAHGWRKKHDPYYVGYTGRQWEHDYGIGDGRCNREAIGTVLGGVVGGVVGSQVADDSDRAVAIVLGTVIGAVIGREIGRNMDERDRACVGHALELAKAGQSVRWLNESSGVTYVLTPSGGGANAGTCRDFELQVSRAGKTELQPSRACRTGDGTWQMK